ncbi:PadR family transcriptional regulator [Catenulispora pinisilvae]|uniref:PadR family transcriptional regulator n=1 Tax=Catenulispora pinisilvae TaxID=2705253 RepID=UPI001891A249|nr:PadR family transcriptional regulator [Catenulispora pinisilvae]
MAPVFGHGRLRLYLLNLLAESPKHGYEIIQQLKERFQGLYAPSAGTVYPRLSRLESEGLIRHETDERGRKVYHITDAGRTELAARADDMAALESEIRESVSSLAEEIRDEVKESARHIQEELRAAAAEARTESKDRAATTGARPKQAPHDHDHAPSAHPPADRSQWGKDEWRDWKRAQNDWKEQWKDQWAAQWREHWQDEATRWQRFAQDSMDDWTGRRPRDRADQEQLDELRSTFLRFRDEVRTMAREHRPDIPVTPDQLNAAREVLERAARELRDIFRS